MDQLAIRVVQMAVEDNDPAKNRTIVAEHVARYRDQDLLLFPELAIGGYDFGLARSSPDENEFFSQLAKKHGRVIIAGFHNVDDGAHYDALGAWDADGKTLGLYRKIHLWNTEREFFSEGDELCVIDLKGWRIGLLLCADLGFPEVSRLCKEMGSEIIVYPSAWAVEWEGLLEASLRVRAAENQVFTIAPNRAGPNYCGFSTVCGPDGNVVAQILSRDNLTIKSILEKSDIQTAGQSVPWHSMRRPSIYQSLENMKEVNDE